MRNNSSIDKITDALKQIKRKRACIRCLRSDRDAAEIAGCAQTLKQCIDNFLVRYLIVVILRAITERSQQVETTMMIEAKVEVSWSAFPSFTSIKCLSRRCERKCTIVLTTLKTFSMSMQRPPTRPLRCVGVHGLVYFLNLYIDNPIGHEPTS